jgi:hypothetical protein
MIASAAQQVSVTPQLFDDLYVKTRLRGITSCITDDLPDTPLRKRTTIVRGLWSSSALNRDLNETIRNFLC